MSAPKSTERVDADRFGQFHNPSPTEIKRRGKGGRAGRDAKRLEAALKRNDEEFGE